MLSALQPNGKPFHIFFLTCPDGPNPDRLAGGCDFSSASPRAPSARDRVPNANPFPSGVPSAAFPLPKLDKDNGESGSVEGGGEKASGRME